MHVSILMGVFYPFLKLSLQSEREAGSCDRAAGLWPVSSFELFKVNDTVRKFRGVWLSSFSACIKDNEDNSWEKGGLYCMFYKCLYLFIFFVILLFYCRF